MENEIMGSIKNKDALVDQINAIIIELKNKLIEQAGKVSEEKMKHPDSDMIAFTNEDNWNYREYQKTKLKIEELEKQLRRLSSENPKA